MNTEVFTNIISHPEILKDFQVEELKNITKKYPYFQSARALYLKGLKNNDSYRYNNELKITAAYTTDRSVLFDFITSIHFEKQFSFYSDFDANAQLTGGVLDGALDEILERVIQDIFNASLGNW